MDSDGKSLVLGSVITQSQKNYSLQVHVSAWNSGVSSQGAAVPMPANCQDRRLLLWLLLCHVWSVCCVLGFQCLQGRELEGLHILAQELLSQLPCVCLEPRVDSSAALLGKETQSFLASTQQCTIARKGNPCIFWPLTGSRGPETLLFFFFFKIAAEYLLKARVHILREKPF